MAEVSKQPWRCHWCKRLNKHHVGVCGSCYAPWDKCIDIHYVHGQKNQSAAQPRSSSRKKWQQSAAWEQWENWGDSPRRRSDTPRQAYAQSPRKRAKGKKNAKDKHKEQTEHYGAPSLDPPWQSTVPAALPANAATGSASSAEGHLLQELVQAIETSDKPISSEVQMVMEKAKKAPEPPPPTAKSVRQAWDKLEKKRKQLQQAQAARANLHQSWAQYIEESVKRWRTFAEDFGKKDQNLEQKVGEAKEAMQEAKEKYDNARAAMEKQDLAQLELQDVEEISDGMEEDGPDKIATSEAIQEGISSMLSTLDNIRVRPQEEAMEAPLKKLRVDQGEDAGERSSPGVSALMPFHKPGK